MKYLRMPEDRTTRATADRRLPAADLSRLPNRPAVGEDVFQAHGRFLWGLCYRMMGTAADADDLVQETFLRAMERPPRRTDEPWRPWLVRVAMNLCRDALRRRRRHRYVDPWLPAPIETEPEHGLPAYEVTLADGTTTEGRYELLESVSFAFLLALEALTPRQRAVLLLRDVFDYSVHETADALDMTEPNVKTTHHRARRTMEAYDRERCVPTQALQARARQMIDQFVVALTNRDVPALEALLTEDAIALSDGGGEFAAALNPILGRDRVIRLYLGLAARRVLGRVDVRTLNGLPAVVIEFSDRPHHQAPRLVMRCEIGRDGRITALHTILATRKLTAVGS